MIQWNSWPCLSLYLAQNYQWSKHFPLLLLSVPKDRLWIKCKIMASIFAKYEIDDATAIINLYSIIHRVWIINKWNFHRFAPISLSNIVQFIYDYCCFPKNWLNISIFAVFISLLLIAYALKTREMKSQNKQICGRRNCSRKMLASCLLISSKHFGFESRAKEVGGRNRNILVRNAQSEFYISNQLKARDSKPKRGDFNFIKSLPIQKLVYRRCAASLINTASL